MDFMKLFHSLEELLYEVIVMLVFFPKTLWLTLRYPQRMMDYADTELGDVQSEQYNDTLSPPLFLMLCVFLSYLVQRAVPGALETSDLPEFLRNSQNLLGMRVLVFSLLPLACALRLLYGLKLPLDRGTLRAPFFSQCFVAAPLAMVTGLTQAIAHTNMPASGAVSGGLTIVALGWFLRQQAHWFQAKLGLSLVRGWVAATVMVLLAFIGTIVIGLVILLSDL